MSASNYGSVQTLIAIDNPVLRKGLNEAFRALGFGKLTTAGRPDQMRTALEQGTFDLIIMSSDMDGDFTAGQIAELRAGRLGEDPFAIVIMLLAVADQGHIRRVIDCGPDDLLLLPVSPKQLLARVDALAKARKPFVVTQDFIGPDRRKEQRPGGMTVPLLEVPNPLKARLANLSDDALRRQIGEAKTRLNGQRLERDIVQVLWLKDAITACLNTDPVEAVKMRAWIERMGEVAEDALRRVPQAAETHLPAVAEDLAAKAKAVDAGGKGALEPLVAACSQFAAEFKRFLPRRQAG